MTLDLQAVFDRCYDAGPYSRQVNYRTDAIVPTLDPIAPPGLNRSSRPPTPDRETV